jgi:hypothetical protein
LAGIFFALWVVEGAYFDDMGDLTVQTGIISGATLFASVSAFAFGTARFAEIWGGYVKGISMKKLVERTGAIAYTGKERN